MDAERLERELERAFDGTDAQRRVVVRQARDLADAGKIAADRGRPLTAETVVRELADAPADASLPERWNWWMGALDAAYGGYEAFQVRRYPSE
ncbi:hypothetical protein ACFQJD_14880 [Haloplanus sp. GCM10025708]|uniref:hypothetical protein n=1 Tax=Haloferacaceae TaxID=1644056 RepID=UPI00360CDC4E